MKKTTTALSLAIFAYAGSLSATLPPLPTTGVDKFECIFESEVLTAELIYPLVGTKSYVSILVSGNFPSEPAEAIVAGGGTPTIDVYMTDSGTTFTIERDFLSVDGGEETTPTVNYKYKLQHGGGHGLSPEFECSPR